MSLSPPEQPKTRKWVLVLGILAIIGGIASCVVNYRTYPDAIPMNDFVQYWSAAKVNLAQGNPYDAAQLWPHQSLATGKPELQNVTMMWNPPWVLVLVTPLGFLSAVPAQLLFQGVQLVAVLVSVTWLWKVYGGTRQSLWVAWVIGLCFGPTAFLLWWGQIGGLVLLGLAGFLYFRTLDRPFIAGLFVALTAIKPHLLFAFGLVLILEALVNRKTRWTVLGGAIAVALAAAAAWAMNPAVFDHYRGAGWESSTDINVSPKDWKIPLVSYWLRMAVNPAAFWIQFVPLAITAVAVGVYWWRKRSVWNWTVETPRLVFASVLTTSYGAWVFDLVVLLVPVCAVAATVVPTPGRKRYLALAAHVLLTVTAVATGNIQFFVTGETMTGLHFFIWVSPAVLALCLWAKPSRSNELESGSANESTAVESNARSRSREPVLR